MKQLAFSINIEILIVAYFTTNDIILFLIEETFFKRKFDNSAKFHNICEINSSLSSFLPLRDLSFSRCTPLSNLLIKFSADLWHSLGEMPWTFALRQIC